MDVDEIRAGLRRVLITDRGMAPEGRSLLDVVARAVERAGITMVVARELDLDPDDQVHEARALIAGLAVPVIMARKPGLAVQAGAAGVQLGWGSPGVAEARRIVGPWRLIGASVHDVDEGLARAADGADYLLLGPVFPTPKRHGLALPIGVGAVGELASRTTTPVVAVGGVELAHEDELRAAGAAGIASIRAFMSAGLLP